MVKAYESYQEYPPFGLDVRRAEEANQAPCQVEWAARPLEAVRAGLRDDDFARWLRALEGAVQRAVLTDP
ncbi:hypothetical protein GCM10017562_75060 [Streptomyces roseofulvus]|uniref:hypothetical protein n=1 Tax=Streptomyces roseofulvus TaxID=33902 RepID=UPI0031FE08E7